MNSIDSILRKLRDKRLNESVDSLNIDDMKDELVKYGDFTESEVARMKTHEIMNAWTSLPRDIKESERMEFATDSEAYEWAEENGYKVDKIQNGTGDRSCIAWMTKMNESSSDEDHVWNELDPAISEAVMKITGNGLDDASYDYYGDSFRCQGVVYFDSKAESNKKWSSLEKAISDALQKLGYEDFDLYEAETEPTSPYSVGYRIYFRARKYDVS